MRSVVTLLSMSICIWITGCKTQDVYLTPTEYLKQANDSLLSPLTIKKTQGGYDFVCGYRPLNFFIARELDRDTNGADITKIKKIYGQATYFVLAVSSKRNDANYTLFGLDFTGQQPMNLLFELNGYFSLVSPEDTIDATLATIDRSWGMSDEVAILAVFPKVEEAQLRNYTLKMNDFGLKCGTVLFDLKSIKTDKLRLQL